MSAPEPWEGACAAVPSLPAARSLRIAYRSEAFPPALGLERRGWLWASWDELAWAILTVGRPGLFPLLGDGRAEALFRLSALRLALGGHRVHGLRRTRALRALAAGERVLVAHYLGMALCRLFAARLLDMPWLLHIDAFGAHAAPAHRVPACAELLGCGADGSWCAFACRGRITNASPFARQQARDHSPRAVAVGAAEARLRIGALSSFTSSGAVRFYWRGGNRARDPRRLLPPTATPPLRLPAPADAQWAHCYRPALLLANPAPAAYAAAVSGADVRVEIHAEVRARAEAGQWTAARDWAAAHGQELRADGFFADGLRVAAGPSWNARARAEGVPAACRLP